MKKVFWTSIVWILLFACFMLYMKRFNQPLAEWMSNFLVKWYEDCLPSDWEEPTNEAEDEETGLDVDTKQTLPTEEETIVEDMPLDTQKDVLFYRDKLFNQLDRIESLVWWEDVVDAQSEEELFDEFKSWYEENK